MLAIAKFCASSLLTIKVFFCFKLFVYVCILGLTQFPVGYRTDLKNLSVYKDLDDLASLDVQDPLHQMLFKVQTQK